MGDSALVTFLFTDLVGSSALWEADAPVMSEALVHHDDLARRAVVGAGGSVFKHTGDGLGATFPRPIDAVSAAISLQGDLVDDPVLSLRIGIHVGHAEQRDGDWFGPTVNRCARIMSICHGGQILVSDATASLVRSELPADVIVTRLGTVRLTGLTQPETVHEVNGPGLRAGFPALPGQRNDNLPSPRTSFVGRDREIGDLSRLLSGERMVTLTGAGGAGKTRLSIEWARAVAATVPDGVVFVSLADLHDAVDIPEAVAEAAGIVGGDYDRPDGDRIEAVVRGLTHRTTVLVLDNCEHLREPARDVINLILDRCPSVKVMATSRQPLGVDGERVYRVPPLDLDSGMALVIDRARAHDASFLVPETEAPLAEELCRRLDGLPLAIELAAARLRTMSLTDIIQRLDDRFSLLGGRGRSSGRHATLRTTLDWSYDLLQPDERCLLTRLSTFVGGFPLTAAEQVCGTPPLSTSVVLDVLEALIDKSLVISEHSAEVSRFRLLESVRMYAADRIDDADEVERLRRRHAAWVRGVAIEYVLERATEDIPREGQFPSEIDNARVAHSWAVRERITDTACLLAAALMLTLTSQGGAKEAIRRCEEALRLGGGSRAVRCTCEIAAARAGQFAYEAGTAWSHALAARDLLPLDGDITAWVWNTVAMAALTAPTGAEPGFDECLSEARAHDPPGDAFFDFLEGLHRLHHGRLEESVELLERADRKALANRSAAEGATLTSWHAACRVNLALARFLGRGETALDDKTIDAAVRTGEVVLFSELRRIQVVTAAARQEPLHELLDESLNVVRNAGLPIGTWLDIAASAAWASDHHRVAVQLWGARGVGQAWTGELGPHLQPRARATLGTVEYDRLHTLGATMTHDEAIDLGLRATTIENGRTTN